MALSISTANWCGRSRPGFDDGSDLVLGVALLSECLGDLVQTRKHPAEHAQTRALAPAVGITRALVDAESFEDTREEGRQDVADDDQAEKSLHGTTLARRSIRACLKGSTLPLALASVARNAAGRLGVSSFE
jgi:hypothetical protein